MTQLLLDERSVDPEQLSMSTLYRELNLQKRPLSVLCKLMSALEAKRMVRKLGWSRPWNKYGLTVFRGHSFDCAEDRDYLQFIRVAFEQLLPELPSQYGEFVDSLFDDPELMGFTFYHNNEFAGQQFEGLTVSLGRKVPEDRTRRDRLDLVLEDRRVDGAVDGLVDRIRIYVNPWALHRTDQHYLLELMDPGEPHLTIAQEAYDGSVALYRNWKDDPERQWQHWSNRYIQYFGARSFIPVGTAFI